jgi:hypothetical protein
LSMEEMAAKTAELLRARNPGAALSAVQRLSSGRGNGFVFTARGPRHSESALALSHRAYRYLVLRRVAVGAPPRSRREAAAIERSFRPR